jgi:hypothetical protein
MRKIYHCSNSSGLWYNSPIRDDRLTSCGAIVLDSDHCGHALVLHGAAQDSQQVYCINSAAFTGTEELEMRGPTHPLRVLPTIARLPARLQLPWAEAGEVSVYGAAGRFVRRLVPDRRALVWDGRDGRGHPVPEGAYVLRSGAMSARLIVTR